MQHERESKSFYTVAVMNTQPDRKLKDGKPYRTLSQNFVRMLKPVTIRLIRKRVAYLNIPPNHQTKGVVIKKIVAITIFGPFTIMYYTFKIK